uniref:Putative lipoprotein n=1 Tax=uncultured bacterium Contig1532b TaxID=1393450 RepID=W0FGB9_9BACT|nr:putative lipoprotein [uncultured bacterium Contig1532b]
MNEKERSINMKKRNKDLIRIASITIAAAMLMAGCSLTSVLKDQGDSSSGSKHKKTKTEDTEKTEETGGTEDTSSASDSKKNKTDKSSSSDGTLKMPEVSDKDKDTSYDESGAQKIQLSDSSGTVNIDKEGTYIVTGSSRDASIVINVSDEEDVHLILRDAELTSTVSSAVTILSADEVYITLEGSNVLSNGGEFKASGEEDIDAVIYSKDDLTINGTGTLKISSPAGHGIVCKDDMVITGGTYDISAKEDGINTNDSIAITEGSFTVNVQDDAILTDGAMQISGGTYNLTCAEGLEGTLITIDEGNINIAASDDGINAAQKTEGVTPEVVINGGSINIKMGAGDTDGIDSNGNIIINSGTVAIEAQSPFDYDGKGELNGGTVTVNGQSISSLTNQFGGGRGGGNRMGQVPDGNFNPFAQGDQGQGRMPGGKHRNEQDTGFDPFSQGNQAGNNQNKSQTDDLSSL